ncbi:MAG: hypothetical protein H8E14_11225 [Candidatus Marinimicrobia bacterium]|nr:hypothetical protein [Candidatus Neomarinimicrobiota bacterium]
MPVVKTTKKTTPEPVTTPDPANYISDKLGKILENIGSEYGESLQNELLNRLERTIAEFDNEVNEMFAELQQRSLARQEQLQKLMEQGEVEQEAIVEEESAEEPAETQPEMSEWERRLEMLEKKKS